MQAYIPPYWLFTSSWDIILYLDAAVLCPSPKSRSQNQLQHRINLPPIRWFLCLLFCAETSLEHWLWLTRSQLLKMINSPRRVSAAKNRKIILASVQHVIGISIKTLKRNTRSSILMNCSLFKCYTPYLLRALLKLGITLYAW